MRCDVADEAAVLNLLTSIEQRFGRLDLLFNNAGVFTPPFTQDELSAAA